jgi:hypothetical protein
MKKLLLLVALSGLQHIAFAEVSVGQSVSAQEAIIEDEMRPGLQELTIKEIEKFQFDVPKSTAVVEDLSLGQRYALGTQRREIAALIARSLGILELKEDRTDLGVIQNLINKKVILKDDVRTWQSLGIIFGDVLEKEFGLDWVSYEDNLGASKALRWRETENYVFPVTMFSKRVQFDEKIDVRSVFNDVGADIESFKAYEQNRPAF